MPFGLKPEGPKIAMYKQADKSHVMLLVRIPLAMTAAIRELACQQGRSIAQMAVETLARYIEQNPAS
jgi:hypothetical protein